MAAEKWQEYDFTKRLMKQPMLAPDSFTNSLAAKSNFVYF